MNEEGTRGQARGKREPRWGRLMRNTPDAQTESVTLSILKFFSQDPKCCGYASLLQAGAGVLGSRAPGAGVPGSRGTRLLYVEAGDPRDEKWLQPLLFVSLFTSCLSKQVALSPRSVWARVLFCRRHKSFLGKAIALFHPKLSAFERRQLDKLSASPVLRDEARQKGVPCPSVPRTQAQPR